MQKCVTTIHFNASYCRLDSQIYDKIINKNGYKIAVLYEYNHILMYSVRQYLTNN